eukprot:TRINITY_DN1851_c2_g1_i2.p1 TRINITY_DN1851_c2_g1~~TRINITY_DN1851_c2_g1_i2.p1  ORF type:complete len:750 (-),score=148.02 TRINITY_DN1851_c2_g1_i2:317-2566(-)
MDYLHRRAELLGNSWNFIHEMGSSEFEGGPQLPKSSRQKLAAEWESLRHSALESQAQAELTQAFLYDMEKAGLEDDDEGDALPDSKPKISKDVLSRTLNTATPDLLREEILAPTAPSENTLAPLILERTGVELTAEEERLDKMIRRGTSAHNNPFSDESSTKPAETESQKAEREKSARLAAEQAQQIVDQAEEELMRALDRQTAGPLTTKATTTQASNEKGQTFAAFETVRGDTYRILRTFYHMLMTAEAEGGAATRLGPDFHVKYVSIPVDQMLQSYTGAILDACVWYQEVTDSALVSQRHFQSHELNQKFIDTIRQLRRPIDDLRAAQQQAVAEREVSEVKLRHRVDQLDELRSGLLRELVVMKHEVSTGQRNSRPAHTSVLEDVQRLTSSFRTGGGVVNPEIEAAARQVAELRQEMVHAMDKHEDEIATLQKQLDQKETAMRDQQKRSDDLQAMVTFLQSRNRTDSHGRDSPMWKPESPVLSPVSEEPKLNAKALQWQLRDMQKQHSELQAELVTVRESIDERVASSIQHAAEQWQNVITQQTAQIEVLEQELASFRRQSVTGTEHGNQANDDETESSGDIAVEQRELPQTQPYDEDLPLRVSVPVIDFKIRAAPPPPLKRRLTPDTRQQLARLSSSIRLPPTRQQMYKRFLKDLDVFLRIEQRGLDQSDKIMLRTLSFIDERSKHIENVMQATPRAPTGWKEMSATQDGPAFSSFWKAMQQTSQPSPSPRVRWTVCDLFNIFVPL